MKFTTTPRFDNDYRGLRPEHQQLFRRIIPAFSDACDAYVADPGGYVWPKRLRVSPMTSAAGIWEITWSLASPDGRATFEFVKINEGWHVRWRRVGNHRIYREP